MQAVAQATRPDWLAKRSAALRRLAVTYRLRAQAELGVTAHALLATARELEAEATRIDPALAVSP